MKPQARMNPARGARVVARTPLLYQHGPDIGLDRPSHVRAGSALVALDNGRLAVVQDDACFIAIIDPDTRDVRDIPFDGDGDTRQFDDTRGNKKRKLDLEAAFVVTIDGKQILVALGSGSSPVRERFVLIEDPALQKAQTPHVTIVEAPALYAAMRADVSFSGSELNLEGACVIASASGEASDLLFFQRGNGAPTQTLGPVDATVRVALMPLLEYLHAGGRGAAPPLRNVVTWDLGAPTGQRLTFTDGALTPRGLTAFLACAEDSPDSTQDGPVTAVAIGILDDVARMSELGLILDERGEPLLDKAEGLAFDLEDPSRAFVVTDRDEPTSPCELLELRLGDAWTT